MPQFVRFPVLPCFVLLAGLGACRASLNQTFDVLGESLESSPVQSVSLPPSEANIPASVLEGCIAEAADVASEPIEIQAAQLLRDGTFLIQWKEGESLAGSCQVDGRGNVIAIASAKLPQP
ncbi:MAG: hypothetical protein F6K04_15740 [Leptolyngbya sp. SIO4C5]|nr:hypothetical protein [Leptolyngbya sp. SIO4C5]